MALSPDIKRVPVDVPLNGDTAERERQCRRVVAHVRPQWTHDGDNALHFQVREIIRSVQLVDELS